MSVLIFFTGVFVGYIFYRYQMRSAKCLGVDRFASAMLAELDREAGFAEWNLSNLTIRASTRQANLYGLEPGRFEGQYQQYLKFVHPDFRVRLDQAVQAALVDNREFELDFIVTCDGEERWLRSKGVVWLEAGQIPRLIEVTQDITRFKNLQEAYRRQELKWRKLTENRVELVATLDQDNCFAFVNSTVESLLGFSPDDLIGQDLLEFVHPDDRLTVAQSLKKVHQRHNASTHFTYRFHTGHDSASWLLVESVACDERSVVGGIVLRTCKLTPSHSVYEIPRSIRS